MRKYMAVCMALVLAFLLARSVEAASAARGAKSYFVISNDVSISTISRSPAVLYAVVLASGAQQEFVSIFDTNTASGIKSQQISGAFVTRVYYSSMSLNSGNQNTTLVFDPPIQMNAGLYAADSAATGMATIIWEKGRVAQGY